MLNDTSLIPILIDTLKKTNGRAYRTIQTTEIERKYEICRRAFPLRPRRQAARRVTPRRCNRFHGSPRLVAFLQDHFDITVEDDEVVPSNLETINNLVVFVAKKLDT